MKYFSMKSMMRTVAMTSSMMLALPAFAQIDGAQKDTHKHAEFLAGSSFAVENCDVIANPEELKEIINLAASKMSSSANICVLPGVTEATFNLKHKGLRLIALQPGMTSLNGATYVNAPTVLFGLNISSLALDKSAAGSVVALSNITKAVSMTSDVILIGNTLAKGIEGPVGRMSVAMHLPSYARGLSLGQNLTPLSATQTGDKTVAGWLPRSSLVSNSDSDDTKSIGNNNLVKSNTQGKKVNVQNVGNIQNAITWFAQTKLVSHTSPNREGETLKRNQDIPVYRNPNTAEKPLLGMIFVPMHTGLQPDLTGMGVILGLN